MATPSIAPTTPPPSTVAPSSFDAVLAQRMQRGDQLAQKEIDLANTSGKAIEDANKRAEEREAPLVAAEGNVWQNMQGALDALKHPPQMEPVHQTTPQQMWTSGAMVFGALASLFTRRPLETAMNSAALALKAYTTGNQQAVNAAFQKWKLDTENFYKVADAQQSIYRTMMEDLRDRLSESDRINDREVKNIVAEVNAAGHALNDAIMANTHDAEQLVQLYEARARVAFEMQTQSTNIITAQSAAQQFQEWKAEFVAKNHRQPTGEEQTVEMGRIRQESGHQWNDQEVTQKIDLFDKQAAASQEGKDYESAKSHLPNILGINENEMNQGTVIQQAQALDQYIQSINGNRAIRGFQVKLIQQDAGLVNTVQHAIQQLQGGGAVTPEMIREMKKLASDYAHIASLQYADYITREQWKHWKVGLDPTEFVPSGFDPSDVPGDHPTPAQKAIAYLKANPTMENWSSFDELYGQGAAARVFSSEGQ